MLPGIQSYQTITSAQGFTNISGFTGALLGLGAKVSRHHVIAHARYLTLSLQIVVHSSVCFWTPFFSAAASLPVGLFVYASCVTVLLKIHCAYSYALNVFRLLSL